MTTILRPSWLAAHCSKKIWADPETAEDQPKANKRRSSATGLTVPKELSRWRSTKFKLRGWAPPRSIPQKL